MYSTRMNTSTANTSTESRALELLATGIEPEQVASALGVTSSRISQIAADPEFVKQLAELKFAQLAKHNATDNEYDDLEKKILTQLKNTIGLVMDPMKLSRILQVVNAAKRRGSSAPDSLIRQRPTVRLNINAALVAKFALNGSNQVVQASIGNDTQDLVTIQSGNVQRLLNEHAKTAIPVSTNSSEADGVVWRKPQGREKQDLLTDLGFAVEVEVAHSAQASG
jgi:hypothetical protein